MMIVKAYNPLEAERMHDRVDAVRTYYKEVRGKYLIMGWEEGLAAEADDLHRLDNFFCDLMDEEQYIGELMDTRVDVILDFARVQIEIGADTIGIGGVVPRLNIDLFLLSNLLIA